MKQDLSGKPKDPQGPNRTPHVPVKSPKIQGHGVDIVVRTYGAEPEYPQEMDLLGTGRPLSTEEIAGLAAGDPFKEHGTVAVGKKECGLCGWKRAGKGDWRCTHPGWIPALPLCFFTPPCPLFLKKPSVIRPPQPKKKGLPVPEGVKFLYIGAPRGKTKKGVPQHQGVVTVAWIEPSPGTLHLGFSFCSPKDRWCKVTGRDMAMARLLTPVVIPFLYDAKRTVREVVRAVVTHDFMRLAALAPGATMIWEQVPSWTMGLAGRIETPYLFRFLLAHRNLSDESILVDESEAISRKPKPTAEQIVARMMTDIANLDKR